MGMARRQWTANQIREILNVPLKRRTPPGRQSEAALLIPTFCRKAETHGSTESKCARRTNK